MAPKEWAKEIDSSDRWRQEKEAISQRKQAHKAGVDRTGPPVHGPADYLVVEANVFNTVCYGSISNVGKIFRTDTL